MTFLTAESLTCTVQANSSGCTQSLAGNINSKMDTSAASWLNAHYTPWFSNSPSTVVALVNIAPSQMLLYISFLFLLPFYKSSTFTLIQYLAIEIKSAELPGVVNVDGIEITRAQRHFADYRMQSLNAIPSLQCVLEQP